MRAWDPSDPPAMDDIRIMRGSSTRRRVDFQCVPLAGAPLSAANPSTESWLAAGPFEVTVAGSDLADTVREDFMVVGVGRRFEERTCEGTGEAVQYVSWAIR